MDYHSCTAAAFFIAATIDCMDVFQLLPADGY